MSKMNVGPQGQKKMPVAVKPTVVGFSAGSTDEHSVYVRKGKRNIVSCHGFRITGTNATGRRLDVEFLDAAGNVTHTRRVYREWVDEMCKKFGTYLPDED